MHGLPQQLILLTGAGFEELLHPDLTEAFIIIRLFLGTGSVQRMEIRLMQRRQLVFDRARTCSDARAALDHLLDRAHILFFHRKPCQDIEDRGPVDLARETGEPDILRHAADILDLLIRKRVKQKAAARHEMDVQQLQLFQQLVLLRSAEDHGDTVLFHQRTQMMIALHQPARLLTVIAFMLQLLHGAAQHSRDLLRFGRLQQKLLHAQMDRLLRIREIIICGQDEHLAGRPGNGADPLQHLQAVVYRHIDVEEDDLRLMLLIQPKRLLPVFRLQQQDLRLRRLDDIGDELPFDLLILCDQYLDHILPLLHVHLAAR